MRPLIVKPTDAPDRLLFLRSLILNPKAIGALTPSSLRLSRLMASCVDAASAPVLEIGAGTGAITQALLERGVSPERLFVIERDAGLTALLRNKFPGVRVRCGDAIHARRILWDAAIPHVRTVVSSIPLRNLSAAERIENIDAMLKPLAQDGQLIQYTYAPDCPIPTGHFGLQAECLGRVWQNLPPAAVWRFLRRA